MESTCSNLLEFSCLEFISEGNFVKVAIVG